MVTVVVENVDVELIDSYFIHDHFHDGCLCLKNDDMGLLPVSVPLVARRVGRKTLTKRLLLPSERPPNTYHHVPNTYNPHPR